MKNLFKPILKMPIKYKISIIVILILATSIFLLANFLFKDERAILLDEMGKKGNLILQNLSRAGWEAIINSNKTVTSDVFGEILNDNSVLYAIVFNKKVKVFDSVNISENFNILEIQNDLIKYNSYVKDKSYNNKKIIEMARPIILNANNKKIIIGYSVIGVSEEPVKHAIAVARRKVIYLSLIFLIIGIVVSFIFASTITAPIKKIVTVMKRVGAGNLEERVNISLQDEIGLLANSFNEMIRHLKEKLLMSKFVSKDTIEMIQKKDNVNIELGGAKKEVTLLFSDIRGFTSFSENHSPEEVINMLNKYLSFQAEIINDNNGAVDKFVGDEVVGVFKGESSFLNAVKCAMKIQQKILEENKKSNDNIHIGIGINFGEVVIGNMGSKDRMDYTVIGDNVNIAARLCDVAKPDQILISESVYKKINSSVKIVSSSEISVKGKSERLLVYAIGY